MKKIVFITGSLGLIGYEAALLFLKKGCGVVGIDNNLRSRLFNIKTQYDEKLQYILQTYPHQYVHAAVDIRNVLEMKKIMVGYSKSICTIIHTAAQTSHDWAKKDPLLDFSINAQATLQLLELYRTYCPNAVFIFTSTNKVYGDLVNSLPFKSTAKRFDLKKDHQYYLGIPESFSIDQSTHSLFGSSKVAADILVQEYGKYFYLNTGVFRLGVITGEHQSGALEQGFLTYLIHDIVINNKCTIIGYEGKQVRDILHAKDVAQAFYLFMKNPIRGEVYNLGGGRNNAWSILEILDYLKHKLHVKMLIKKLSRARTGDHKWWISDYSKFQKQYPQWKPTSSIKNIIDSIITHDQSRQI
ncbi:NAD-dependent epimerase [Candidatus Roizmanbacteria bacterium CG_4_10_14_0_8_um_filter_39_9]|uniref:NAD-dependent epimerase n=1 Tax=Candidatus Roizmanbacteria bacterium CG_4_10_14_0_8_um_filter_39_9 TaxID=1974829 RepID=A0A2M7QDZ1_9BACT|nr:MAG: NAD-dependent epimerase [Candidatus Roizmanbacteria bacterium CG_4_10_14_0_8_um_filter_39_9]